MRRVDIILVNKLGLHARAAAKFVGVCAASSANITVTAGSKTIDGKRIMSVLLLAAKCGATLTIEADGEDEEQALLAIVELIENRFGESE